MATIAMSIGPLTAERTNANNTKVGDTVKAFALATGAPATATNQQFLDHALNELILYMVRVGRQQRMAAAADAAAQAAETEIGF